jgi:GNAT superfamily N-acetyltransferase
MITYDFLETLEQRPLIVKYLQEYNLTFTGIRPSEDRYFYVLDDKKLRGAIYAHLGWDWVTLSKIYYEDIETLRLLLSKISLHFKGKAEGISFDSDNILRLNDFYKIGFNHEGTIEKTPNSKEKHITSHTTFDIASDTLLAVIQKSEIDSNLDKELENKLSSIEDEKKTDVIILAKDNGSFVGGVHGEIRKDRMYISLLVVVEKYKGHKIGTKLLEYIEEEALKKGVVCIDLGTCDFQAKPFYEKRGYNVISTLHNYPQGFNEYTLVKRLK